MSHQLHRILLLRLPRPSSRSSRGLHRLQSTKSPSRPKPNINPSPQTPPPNTRLHRVLGRLPKFLHPYTSGLRHAPVTHIASFLILHELTAIIPLIGLASWFHWGGGMDWFPRWLLGVGGSQMIPQSMEKFGSYFRRKGWFGFGRDNSGGEEGGDMGVDGRGAVVLRDDGALVGVGEEEGLEAGWMGMGKRETIWTVGERGSRILVEVATAYAITKALLPARVLLTLWGTPWFASRVLGLFACLRGGMGGKS